MLKLIGLAYTLLGMLCTKLFKKSAGNLPIRSQNPADERDQAPLAEDMSFHSHNRYRAAIHFRWDLSRIDPAWVTLLGAIKDVRAAAGQEGVEKFIAEWRKRGHLECSDEDAARLALEGRP